MKRKHNNEVNNPSNKNPRKNISSDIFDESFNNCFCNVSNLANALGYFTGKVDMVWSHIPDKLIWNFVAKCCLSDKKHKITVSLEGDWVQYLKESRPEAVAIMDDLQLSLDGVSSAENRKTTAKLIFKEGVIFQKFRSGESFFMNTWQLQRSETKNKEDDWFGTPDVPFPERVSDLIKRMTSGRLNDAILNEENTTMENIPSEGSMTLDSLILGRTNGSRRSPVSKQESTDVDVDIKCESPVIAISNQVRPNVQGQVTLQSRPAVPQGPQRKGKKWRKQANKKDAAAEILKSVIEQPSAQNPLSETVAVAAGSITIADNTEVVERPTVINLGRRKVAKIDDNTLEGCLAQLNYLQPQYIYSTMKQVLNLKAGALINVIGIVRGCKAPHRSRNGDWTTTIHLQDSTSFEDSDYLPTDFSIVFFQGNFEEWLPQASDGDILILRGIRLQDFNGLSGVGYKDRTKWAAYSTSKESMLQPSIGQAPETDSLAAGGFHLSPFLKELEHEKPYCKRLANWWKEKNSLTSETDGQVHQLIGPTIRRYREHRLFCDVGPDVEPNGYFDCTFEVLNGFESENQVFILYVTDYTRNTRTASCQAPWCPVGLNEYVLLFNLWDEAATRGRDFQPQTYWAVRNARMIRGNNGFAEGKLVETKFNQVDSDDDYPPLQALLERKKQWEKQKAQNLPSFRHKLFQDVQEKELFNCTVELLHIVDKVHQTHLFVTDYTEHPRFLYPCDKDWSQGLEGRVVVIQLRDNQVQNAKSLKENGGKFLAIKNLRLLPSGTGKKLQGDLGGYDLLLDLLQPDSPNEDLQALHQRKKEFQHEKEKEKNNQKEEDLQPYSQACEPEILQAAIRPNLKIAQIEASTKDCLKARLIARVIDYYPRSPSNWVRLWCCQCKQRIPKENKACRKCLDIDHEFVRPMFELILLVEDKIGDRAELMLRGESDFLQGIEIGNNMLDLNISGDLLQRLKPLLGNLGEKEDAGDILSRNSVFSSLIIGRVKLPDLGPTCLLINVED